MKIRVIIDNGFETLEAELARYSRVFAVMDSRVASECEASHALAELFGRRGVPGMLIEASEQTKTMDTVMEVCSWLLEQGADRDALVLAIGGGVTSDIVGLLRLYTKGECVLHIFLLRSWLRWMRLSVARQV